MLPVTVAAQTPADYYWWRALERAERGDLAEAGEDLRSAARYTSDPEFAFAVTSTLLDVDTGLALVEYAQTLRRAKRPHEAVVVEERAALFRQAKFGRSREESSVYLGFSPSDLLKEYASELRQCGSSAAPTKPGASTTWRSDTGRCRPSTSAASASGSVEGRVSA